MSTEELLKPRYKVIADYPNSPYSINWMIEFDEDEVHTDKNNNRWNILAFQTYPHLFKKLEWWEERKESEMPEYVKYDPEKTSEHVWDRILKVKEWTLFSDGMGCFFENKSTALSASYLLPATEEEYIQYQQNKNTENK